MRRGVKQRARRLLKVIMVMLMVMQMLPSPGSILSRTVRIMRIGWRRPHQILHRVRHQVARGS